MATIFLLFLLVALLTTAFWIWMLVAAISREEKSEDKILWVIIILVLHFVGALLYFFMRYRQTSAQRY
jgi:heme/copper-type cytochrome/quinol oxidase subunit 2